jgi:hypothetical protein
MGQVNRPLADGTQAQPTSGPVERGVRRHHFGADSKSPYRVITEASTDLCTGAALAARPQHLELDATTLALP